MNTTDILERIDQLLATRLPHDNFDRAATIPECQQATVTLLSIVHGPESRHREALNEATTTLATARIIWRTVSMKPSCRF